ncbi:MAG: hypothetical protein PVF82_03670 [Gammaproteobacteria bacterium]|jgi:hypothetical protein
MSLLSNKNLFPTSVEENPKLLQRLKKLGVVCFLFFFIKGLLWLLLPVALYWFSAQ